MNLEYLLVTFKENRTVLADGTPVGVTNHVLMLPPGGYDITLDGAGTTAADIRIDLLGTSIVRPMTVAFSHLNVGIHTCSDKRTHSYFDWQLAALKKDNNGNPLCTVDGTIVK